MTTAAMRLHAAAQPQRAWPEAVAQELALAQVAALPVRRRRARRQSALMQR
jgi:hypothetical protein